WMMSCTSHGRSAAMSSSESGVPPARQSSSKTVRIGPNRIFSASFSPPKNSATDTPSLVSMASRAASEKRSLRSTPATVAVTTPRAPAISRPRGHGDLAGRFQRHAVRVRFVVFACVLDIRNLEGALVRAPGLERDLVVGDLAGQRLLLQRRL